MDKGQEGEAGLVNSKATLVVASREDSGQEEGTQVLLSGEVDSSSREEAGVSPEVVGGDFNLSKMYLFGDQLVETRNLCLKSVIKVEMFINK